MALYVKEPYIPASLVQLRCDPLCTIRVLHVHLDNRSSLYLPATTIRALCLCKGIPTGITEVAPGVLR